MEQEYNFDPEFIQKTNDFVNSDSFNGYIQSFNGAFEFAYNRHPFNRTEIKTNDDVSKFISFCHSFWFALPDSSDIRFGAFFEICNYCEI